MKCFEKFIKQLLSKLFQTTWKIDWNIFLGNREKSLIWSIVTVSKKVKWESNLNGQHRFDPNIAVVSRVDYQFFYLYLFQKI